MLSCANIRLTVLGVILVSVTLCLFFFGATTRLKASFCSGKLSRDSADKQSGLTFGTPIPLMEEYNAAAAAGLIPPPGNLGAWNIELLGEGLTGILVLLFVISELGVFAGVLFAVLMGVCC